MTSSPMEPSPTPDAGEPAAPMPDDPVIASDDAMLRRWLVGRDAPCPRCGYNVRQASEPRCPECGIALKLTVGAAEPFRAAWVVTLVPLAMTTGVGAFLLLITSIEGLPPDDYMPAVVGFWIASPLVAVVALLRHRFSKLPRPWQWGLATAAWVALFALFTLIGRAFD